jgi:hypothetical protein
VEFNPAPAATAATPERVERLVVLPFIKALEIAFKSIQVRFFRSLITTMSLVLAVSFLSFVSVSTDVANGLLATGDPELHQALVRSGYDLLPQDTRADSSPKQRWIVILSMLVCVVGIVNAQLMAVTERFREIGTMKCLGALDRFILRLFLMEASMQGIAGASLGALAGGLFALAGALLRFGAVALTHLPWSEAAFSLVTATVTGCLLSLVGVLYPAIVAARMQPVEAMRAEH